MRYYSPGYPNIARSLRRCLASLGKVYWAWMCVLWWTTYWGIPGNVLGAEPPTIPGPVQELKILDDFTSESRAAWQGKCGENVEFKFETGLNMPGIAESLAKIEFRRKDPNNHEPGRNWFSMKRDLPPGAIASNATGIRLLIGSQPATQWWINVVVSIGHRARLAGRNFASSPLWALVRL
ncbi:MAG TPA: hypothetical protein VL970_03320, partial [Candidatus Acidoferrales bacterium]|nr:hypothetical protein [Candidatus Acidoferrales bacterium]